MSNFLAKNTLGNSAQMQDEMTTIIHVITIVDIFCLLQFAMNGETCWWIAVFKLPQTRVQDDK